MISWTYQSESATTAVDAAGQPVATEQNTAGRHGITTVAVDYRDRTWWTGWTATWPGRGAPGLRCSQAASPPGCGRTPGPGQSFIRQELSLRRVHRGRAAAG